MEYFVCHSWQMRRHLVVTGFSGIDFLGVAARDHTLYVASTTAGTVCAMLLPLRNDEAPTYTIPTIPQSHGVVGVAVDGSHLYVSLFAVPYTTSESISASLPKW